MHRTLVTLCLLGACGRIDFDPLCAGNQPYETAVEPYEICSADQLDAIGQHPEHWGSAFALTQDLTLAGRTITMIGTKTMAVRGPRRA